MDVGLLQSLTEYATANSEATVLEADEADRLRLAVADHFGFTPNRVWWWETLPEDSNSLSYAGDAGLERLTEALPDTNLPMWLFVTDDEPPPWPCIAGSKTALIQMLREQRFFEYFIVDSDMKWIVFDTHHNVLIALGTGLRFMRQ